MLDLTSLTDWQWAGLVGIALVSLALGGILRRNSSQDQGPHHPDAEFKDAREEAELTLLQLHQVQEELEQTFLADQNKQSQINTLQEQLQQAQQQLKASAPTSPDRTSQLEAELKDAREEAKLTLLQLHQVQEELEHYFLESRDLQQKLDQFETTSKTAQQNELRDDQVALLQSLKLRIHNLILEKNSKQTSHSDPERLEVMLLRQQALLRRCSQLLKNQHRFNKAQQKPSPDQDNDLVFL
jgi:chromosome segregation ATPase